MSSPTPTLVESLTQSLSMLSSTRKLSVHVLETEARKTTSLYAHAAHHPKGVHLHDVMVMLYIHLTPADLYVSPSPPPAASAAPAAVPVEGVEVPSSAPPVASTAASSSSSAIIHPVLLVALEAQIYALPPLTSNSLPSLILYISKVDTSGYPLPRSLSLPYARTLLTSVLSHHLALPSHSVFIHLFARAQPQYLFPDSGEDRQEEFGEKGKKVVGGAGLCRWWKGVFESAVVDAGLGNANGVERRVWIPEMNAEEAKPILKTSTSVAGGQAQTWGHDLKSLPTPLASDPATLPMSLRIPTFSDDPKSRFLVDLTENTSSSAPPPPPPSSAKTPDAIRDAAKSASDRARVRAEAALEALEGGEDEFWERLAFRQECSLGDTVAFFCVANVRSASAPTSISNTPATSSTTTTSEISSTVETMESPAATGQVTKTLWQRLHATLLNQAFSSAQRIVDGSEVVWEAVRSLTPEKTMVGVEGIVEAVKGAVGGVKRAREDEVERKEPVVQVLGVRKKVKKVVA